MKSFYEMAELMAKGGLGSELNAVDFIQLGGGHWAGHNARNEVFVSVEKYPPGSMPESGFSTFKYEEGRKATAEEANEYWGLWRSRQQSSPGFPYDSDEA